MLRQLLEELDVGAGATMSKLDDEADFDAQFLARDEASGFAPSSPSPDADGPSSSTRAS